MTFPILNEYKAALSNAKSRCASLDITVQRDARGNPLFLAGNFAGVFKTETGAGQSLAVKCFIRDLPQLERRYAAVAAFIKAHQPQCFIDLTFLPDELFVTSAIAPTGDYPVVTMPWVSGKTLGTVAAALCEKGNVKALAGLTRAWARLCLFLLDKGVAHGDLKHDNVLVTPEGRLKLIDYDSMYLPELKGLRCTLLGGVNFQHPRRDESYFDAHMDDFSMLVVLLSLRALVLQPDLYAKRCNGENLIFVRDDLFDPASSSLFRALLNSDDFFVQDWARKLAQACLGDGRRISGLSRMLKTALKLDVHTEQGGIRRLLYMLPIKF